MNRLLDNLAVVAYTASFNRRETNENSNSYMEIQISTSTQFGPSQGDPVEKTLKMASAERENFAVRTKFE